VAGLYLSPPEHAVVLCAGEKSQIQAPDRSSPVLPMMPGMPEKRTRDAPTPPPPPRPRAAGMPPGGASASRYRREGTARAAAGSRGSRSRRARQPAAPYGREPTGRGAASGGRPRPRRQAVPAPTNPDAALRGSGRAVLRAGHPLAAKGHAQGRSLRSRRCAMALRATLARALPRQDLGAYRGDGEGVGDLARWPVGSGPL
jgi:hypothetical protein